MQLTLEKHYFNMLMNHSNVFPWRPSEHKSACSMTSVSAVSIPLGPCEILEVWILKACLNPYTRSRTYSFWQVLQKGHIKLHSNTSCHLGTNPWAGIFFNLWPPSVHWSHWAAMRHTGGARDETAMRRPQASSDFIWWKRLQCSFCRALTDTSVVKKKLSSTSGDIFHWIHEFPN